MAYEIFFKPSARKSLLKIAEPIRSRLLAAVDAMRINPRPTGVAKLQGDDNLWRIRVGQHRIVYEIYDGRLVVVVVRVADRKDVYR